MREGDMPKRKLKGFLVKFPTGVDFLGTLPGHVKKPAKGLFLQEGSLRSAWLHYAGMKSKHPIGVFLPTTKVMKRLARRLIKLADYIDEQR
jgi:hypothetical protein